MYARSTLPKSQRTSTHTPRPSSRSRVQTGSPSAAAARTGGVDGDGPMPAWRAKGRELGRDPPLVAAKLRGVEVGKRPRRAVTVAGKQYGQAAVEGKRDGQRMELGALICNAGESRTLRTAVFPPLVAVAGGGGESSSPPALQSCNLPAISVPE
jgi:hypothetical protein